MPIKVYGAKVVLSDGKLGMKGSIAKAEELQKDIPGSFIPAQFDNIANCNAHRKTTGPEIWRDTDGRMDIFVAGIGTGGTITGTGEYLKDMNPAVQIIGMEPAASPFLSKGTAGAHGIQGIGAGFAPSILNQKIYDEIITVEDDEAIKYGKLIGTEEGFLVIFLAKAACGRIARVGEYLLAILYCRCVESIEAALGHIHFTAQFDDIDTIGKFVFALFAQT